MRFAIAISCALMLSSSLAVSAAPRIDLAPDRKPVAKVLGKAIYVEDLAIDESDETELRDYRAIAAPVLGPLMEKYVTDHQLAATPAEIAAFRAYFQTVVPARGAAKRPPSEQEIKGQEAVAKIFVERWKFNKSLYEKYGGRVAFQQAGPEPVEAYQRWLEDEQKARRFELVEPRWRDAFWEYYRPKYHVSLADNPDAFKVPQWERKREEKP
jgi:hypothetical protein